MQDDEHDRKDDTKSMIATLTASHRRFLTFLEKKVGNRQDAEEILQAAFVGSLSKADQIRDSEKVIAWFYRLLRNAVIDHYRRKAASQRLLETFARELMAHDESPDPGMENVICACVNDLVAALKPEYAELVTNVDLKGVDLSSVADSLGIEPGNARVRLHRGRKALRRELERTCRTCATHGCLDCTCGNDKDLTESRPPK